MLHGSTESRIKYRKEQKVALQPVCDDRDAGAPACFRNEYQEQPPEPTAILRLSFQNDFLGNEIKSLVHAIFLIVRANQATHTATHTAPPLQQPHLQPLCLQVVHEMWMPAVARVRGVQVRTSYIYPGRVQDCNF